MRAYVMIDTEEYRELCKCREEMGIMRSLVIQKIRALNVASSILSENLICPYNEVEDGELAMCSKHCTNNMNHSCWYKYLTEKGMRKYGRRKR